MRMISRFTCVLVSFSLSTIASAATPMTILPQGQFEGIQTQIASSGKKVTIKTTYQISEDGRSIYMSDESSDGPHSVGEISNLVFTPNGYCYTDEELNGFNGMAGTCLDNTVSLNQTLVVGGQTEVENYLIKFKDDTLEIASTRIKVFEKNGKQIFEPRHLKAVLKRVSSK